MENGLRPPIQMAAEAMRTMQIGFQGEQNAQQIRINVEKWLEKWPDASIHLMLTLPGEKTSYPASTRIENGELIFLPGYGDTQKAGHGAAYVAATRDGTHLAVSETVLTEILLRGRGGETIPEAPEAQAGWVANVLDAAHRAEEAAKRAENAQVTDEQVGKAVEDFLRENPVEFEEKDPTVPEWAKAKEKPTYTAEEVGAQPKGDYALKSEIPAPYTLPVASADTLGGVMVGDGLQMDGEKLGVRKRKLKLIEEITLSEPVTEVKRTKEPDGTPYKFDELQIVIIADKSDSAKSVLAYAGKTPEGNGIYIYQQYANTTNITTTVFDWVKEHGYWKAKKWSVGTTTYPASGSVSKAEETTAPTMSKQYSETDIPEIWAFLLVGNGAPFDAGVRIQIWGVRADA